MARKNSNHDLIINSAGDANNPSLRINNASSNTYNHSIESFNSNLTSGESELILFGKEGSTKNSGYIGYYWSAAGSDDNYITIGHWAANHLLRVHGSGSVVASTNMQAPIFYDSNDTSYYINPASTSNLFALQVTDNIIMNTGQFYIGAPNTTTDDSYRLYEASGELILASRESGSWLTRFSISNGGAVVSHVDHRAPIFYDLNDTSYYANPASTSNFNQLRLGVHWDSGTLENNAIYAKNATDGFGMGNGTGISTWFAWSTENGLKRAIDVANSGDYINLRSNNTDRLRINNSGLSVQNSGDIDVGNIRIVGDNDSADQGTAWIRSNGDYLVLNAVDGEHVYLNWDTAGGGSGHVYVEDRVYAMSFFDRNDTNYYLDPNGQSRLHSLNLGSSPGSGVTSGYIAQFRGSIHMTNSNIDYVSTLHFNDGVRFYDDGNNNYLNFKWGSAANGGIKFLDGQGVLQGYVYGSGNGDFGILDKDGHWTLITDGATYTALRANNNEELIVYTNRVEIPGDIRAPIFYDRDDTGYYVNPAGTSNIATLGVSTVNALLVNATNGVKSPNQRTNYVAHKWVAGSSFPQAAVFDGSFQVNGTSSENVLEYGVTPSGGRGLLWKATNNDTASNADGGWAKNIADLGDDKSYISICYVKRVGTSTSGNFYHGCHGSHTLNMDGTANTNPYFIATNIGNLTQDVWCVSIGVIQANNDSNTSSWSDIDGVYRLDTGERILDNATFKMKDGSTAQSHRTYLYYSTDSNAQLQWYNPGFYEINGQEPSLNEILNRDKHFKFNGNLNVEGQSYLQGKVGINTTNPAGLGYSFAQDLVILGGNSANDGVGITLRGNNKRYGVIAFGDNADDNAGEIYYDHNNDQMSFRTGTSVGLEIQSGNVVISTGDMRAPIFYDSNDTNYYVNPAGGAVIQTLTIDDYIYHKGDTNTYLYFETDSIKLRTGGDDRLHITNTVTTLTNDVKITSSVGGKLHLRSTDTAIVNGDYIGNLYFEGVDSGGAADNLGAAIHAIATDTWNNTQAPAKLIFKTRSASAFSTALTLGSDQSAAFAGNVTGSAFIASAKVETPQIQNTTPVSILNGSAAQGVSVRHMFAAGTYNTTPGQGDVWATSDMRAPIFYDYDNTTYYLDPSATGLSLKTAGKVEHKGLQPTDGTNIDQVKEYSMTFQLAANTWTDTGIDGTDLTTGTYVMQVLVDDYAVNGAHYSEYYSATISWYSANTNSTSVDEIIVHRAGHAPQSGDVQFRTQRTLNADSHDLMLQVKHNSAYNAALDGSTAGKKMIFKFRRLI